MIDPPVRRIGVRKSEDRGRDYHDAPSLRALGVPLEMLEGAEEIVDLSDVVGLERHTLELLVRYVVWVDRLRSGR